MSDSSHRIETKQVTATENKGQFLVSPEMIPPPASAPPPPPPPPPPAAAQSGN